MQAASGFTAQDIAQAMKAKAQDAYGHNVTSPFTVENLEQHRADVSYTVTASYLCESQSRPVRHATGPVYAPAQVGLVLAQRQGELLASPGFYRDRVQAELNAKSGRYREPARFYLMSDSEVCCSLQNCQGCAGSGTVNCSTCSGRASYSCRQCHGQCRLRCTSCSGSGNTSHSRHCSACGGSGNYAGGRCNNCSGTGTPGSPCYRCSASGQMTCDGCHGSGSQACTACNRGQVTCGTCDGARELIYEYHLDVYADTAVRYGWSNLSAAWLEQAMRDTMNTPQRHTVFSVDRYQIANDDPCVFTASGQVLAAQARVTYQGTVGDCRFIGPQLAAVFLDGVLSGGFKKAVEGVKNYQDIRKVNAASSSKIARQLIAEMETHNDVQKTSPVRKGIISATDAGLFISSRCLSLTHILTTRRQFRWGAVFGFSLPVFRLLLALYALMSWLSRSVPTHMAGNEGFLGLFALLHNPQSVAIALVRPLTFMAYETVRGDYMQFACWVMVAMIFNRFSLPMLAPRVWAWAQPSWPRLIALSVPGILLLDLFMAMHPSGFVHLRFSALVPRLYLNVGEIISWLILYAPQIYVVALLVSLVRYKAAGAHWGARMLRILLQKKDVSGYGALLR